MSAIAQNLDEVRTRMAAAAVRAGRAPADVQLVAVTKSIDPERIQQATAAGAWVCGESKIQEARAKIPLLSDRLHWHLIGHLQTNKVRDAVSMFELIHSVDSVKLAVEINKWAERTGKSQAILIEVNVGDEASKFGFKPDLVEAALEQINSLPRIEVHGLMTVAPFSADIEQVRPCFRKLRSLRDRLGLRELSMGMTHDFEAAIEEGATMVRVGTAIFGERRDYELTE